MTRNMSGNVPPAPQEAAEAARRVVVETARQAREIIHEDALVARELVKNREMNQRERLAVVEAELEAHSVTDLVFHAEVKVSIDKLTNKLDELLELKAKGMGAIWLIGILLGGGVLAFISTVVGWFKH